jgi:mannosyltransferase OCH1-like enzyme
MVAIVYYTTSNTEGFKDIQASTYEIEYYIPRKSTNSLSVIAGVPLVIYQSWHTNYVPPKMKDTIYKLIAANPDFDYYLYSDENCRKLIKEHFENDVLDAFDLLKPGAYKSDLWRYCVLYKFGGVYLDIKYYSVKPISKYIQENPIVYVKDMQSCEHLKDNHGLYNGFMISPPNNIILKYCIDDIVNSCKLRLYKSNCLDVTGPCLLSYIVSKYAPDYKTKFKFNEIHTKTRDSTIYYEEEPVLLSYKEYRKEQKSFQNSTHYGEAWASGDIYNEPQVKL